MGKRTYEEVRNAILKVLEDGKEHSYGDIERKANTNWQSVRKHCKDLEFFKVAKLEKGKMIMTKEGKEFLRKKY